MERLILKTNKAQKAINSLKEILNEPFSIYIRDASIQRFEYTFEAFWKFIKEYLKFTKGIQCSSPKDCFRELLSVQICNEDEVYQLLQMTDSRNETSHTYNEEVAEKIYSKIKLYCHLIDKIIIKLKI